MDTQHLEILLTLHLIEPNQQIQTKPNGTTMFKSDHKTKSNDVMTSTHSLKQ